MARWGTAEPKAVHQGLVPCGRGGCPRSAPRKPAPLCILTVIDTGPRAPLLRRAAPQLHYKNGCQWNPAKSLSGKVADFLVTIPRGMVTTTNALRLLDTSQPDNTLSGHSASLLSKATQRGLCGLSRAIPGTPATMPHRQRDARRASRSAAPPRSTHPAPVRAFGELAETR